MNKYLYVRGASCTGTLSKVLLEQTNFETNSNYLNISHHIQDFIYNTMDSLTAAHPSLTSSLVEENEKLIADIKPHCCECNKPLRQFCVSKSKRCYREGCDRLLCAKCHGKYSVMAAPGQSIESYCKPCFELTSSLDFTRTYDIVRPSENKSSFVYVMVHGGGGSRTMFSQHARLLAENYHTASVLLDLPGHGTLRETHLSLESCVSEVRRVLNEEKEVETLISNKKLIYVGGSLGAYTGFYTLTKIEGFAGAILVCCGQNVGPGASLKARLGMKLLRFLGTHYSNHQLMNMMKIQADKSPADFYLDETTYCAGMFFDQAAQQTECLSTVAPLELLPLINIPILFINGSKDHRDSEQKWLEGCTCREQSHLKVYEGADHFVSHDSRFVDEMLLSWDRFSKQICEQS